MVTLFYSAYIILVVSELIKGLSTNGTPPVLQKFSWQLDLAYMMWSCILAIRILLVTTLLILLWWMSPVERSSVILNGVLLTAIWLFVYWLFNLFWIGKYKFLPLTNPTFASSSENKIPLNTQVIGVEQEGHKKAYPVSMLFYHHQIPDTIGNHPIWVTYCGLCRSGRVYDVSMDGKTLEFELIGAITFNAVFKDKRTGSWWRQETGKAAKGPSKGNALKDIPMEQMSLKKWLEKCPDSQILQYDPNFQNKYNFITNLMNYEASLPGWHMQDSPSLIIGMDLDGYARAYDLKELKKRRLVLDTVGETDLLLLISEDESSAFAYDRTIDGETQDFRMSGNELIDTATQSKWNTLGQCIAGTLKGSHLASVQIYQQNVRGWVSFHPHTTFYNYETSDD